MLVVNQNLLTPISERGENFQVGLLKLLCHRLGLQSRLNQIQQAGVKDITARDDRLWCWVYENSTKDIVST